MDFTPEEKREFMLSGAKKELARLKAMRLLIKADDDCAVQLKVDGSVDHAFSSSRIFLPIINNEIKEIQKAIDDKPNKWQ